MNIGIWGIGIVGSATGKVLEQAHKVYYYDKYKKDPKLSTDKELVDNCQIIFITVPTPMLRSGRIGIRDIKDSLMQIRLLTKSRRIIVIKSTVVPGTTMRFAFKFSQFDFAHNPEFLRAKYAYEDMLTSKRIVIGVEKNEVYQILEKMYREVFKDVPIIKATFAEAEIVKYASNIFLSGQIALANELYQICKKLGINYKAIEQVLSYDKRIGTNIKMPGPDGKLGFGGVCLDGNEYVLTKTDKDELNLTRIADLHQKNNIKIRGLNNSWITVNAIGRKRDNILAVKLSKGLRIKCDPNHLFVVIQNGKMQDVKASDLKLNDEIPIQLEKLPEQNIVFDLTKILSVEEKFNVIIEKKKYLTKKERKMLHTYSHRCPKRIKYKNYMQLNKPMYKDRITTRYNSISSMKLKFNMDKSLARLMGYYLSEGNITENKIFWNFGSHEKCRINDVIYILRKKGIYPNIRFQNSTCVIKVGFPPLVKFWKALKMGENALTKKIPNCIIRAKKDIKFNLLKGYFRGDGNAYIGKEGYITISCASVSRDLIEGILLLLRDRLIKPSLKYSKGKTNYIENRKLIGKNYYSLYISEMSAINKLKGLFEHKIETKIRNQKKKHKIIASSAYKQYPNFYTVKVKNISNVGKGTVYGLSLKESPYFVTSGGMITHNCFPKDLNALIYRSREAGYRPYLLEEIWRLNLKVRTRK